jgi:conjugative transposon protein traO
MRWLFSLLTYVLLVSTVQAQRLLPKQRGIELSVGMPIHSTPPLIHQEEYKASLALTRYFLRSNYGFLAVGFEQKKLSYRSYHIPLQDATLQLGYMKHLLSDRGKNVLLYTGISVLGGYEILNQGKSLLSDGATLRSRSHWLYGGAVHTSLEIFLSDKFLLLAMAEGRLLFHTDLDHLRLSASVGFRYNF